MYKLAFLLKALHLEGKNSHLADEDIAATKALVDYCYQKATAVIPAQREFTAHVVVRKIAESMQRVKPFFERIAPYLDQAVLSGHTFSNELSWLHEDLVRKKLINPLGEKFGIFLQFVRMEWETSQETTTLRESICRHTNDITASMNEGDLINSEGLIHDRVFIMTVHKGKGLEFGNVIILEANDGTYPFFTVNRVLEAPYRHTNEEVEQARQELQEDARKFYVALSRAKKRLCISYTHLNSSGFKTQVTPFVTSIRRFFAGNER